MDDLNKSTKANSATNRRNFLKTSSASIALGLTAANYRAASAAPSDKIRMGFIGLGGMGTGRLNEFMRQDDTEIVAVCDVDSSHLANAVKEVEKRRNKTPDTYSDFRELCARKDLDGVMIATPDHWHALTAVTAMNAGKDVFVEKPLCHSINEGRAMVEAAKRNQRITQMGNHIHSGDNYRRVVEMVQSGKLGRITKIACWKKSYKSNMGKPDNATPPPELDYNFWQGAAPKEPYNPNRSHFTFRYFWDYSGGDFMDFWCHITDIAFWAMELGAPLTVSATGSRWYNDDNAETPDAFEATLKFPGDIILTWTLHPKGLPGYEQFGHIGCVFQGMDAACVTNYGENKVFVDGKEKPDFKRPPETIPNSPGHIRQFLDCMKSRKQADCNVEYAFKLTKPGLLCNIAYRLGETLHWDDEKEQVIGNYRANQMVMRKYRRPWSI